MAVNIKLKRSNLTGAIPSPSSLELGELALNTADGKAFMKKSDGNVVEIGAVSTSSISASYANTAGYAITAGSSSYSSTSTTASYSLIATSSSFAATASYAANVPLTASYANNATSASYALTASYAANVPQTASYAISASYATTASSADDFLVRGTLTAQTIVAQYITSSTSFITGSTKFGTISSNTHEFTGSVSISGSLGINGVDYNSTSASFNTRILNNSSSIGLLSGSYLASSSSFDTRILSNSSSISLLSSSYLADSASFDTRILNNSSSISSNVGSLNNFSASILNYTASNNDSIAALYAATASLYNATASIYNATASIYAATASLSASVGSLSSSFLNTSSSLSTRVSDLEIFSSSLDATFATDAQLNYSSSVLSGSTSALSASFLSVSSSNSIRISSLEQFSSSLNNTFATDADLNALSSSFIAFTSSINSFTSSVNSYTASNNDAISALYAATSSLNSFSASINSYTSSNNASIAQLYNETSSILAATASLYAFSASINNYTASNNAVITQLYNETSSLKAATAQLQNATSSLYNATASLYNFSASINAFTASQAVLNGTFATTASNTFVGNQIISGSLNVSNGITGSLFGTSSFANYATSASYAATASSAQNTSDILIYVKNSSGAQINKGKVVRIAGAVGDNPLISTASYEDDNNSANTLGITNENIANDSFGYVMTEGTLLGINTNGFTSGQLLYLGATGSIIGTAPVAPLHAVRLGQVLRTQLNNGSIYVRIDNGYELGELHDVRDFSTTSSYGDLLVKSGSVWTNSRSLTGSYSLTGSLNGGNINVTSFTASNALITNNLAVNGTASFNYVQTITGSAVIIGQEYIILNTQTPAARYAGIKVYDSGSNSTSSIVWDSLTNHWVYENATGSVYSGGGFLAGPKNTGSLDNITYPTQYRVLRSQGDDHVYDSNIYDDNNTIRLEINTAVTGTLNVTNGITGSLLGNVTGNLIGTASYSSNTDLLDGLDSTQFVLTSSFQNYSASIQAFSASILNATASYNTFSSSINAYTSSNNAIVTQLYNTTASLYAFSASINSYTSSNNSVITSLYSATASLNAFSASILNYTSSTNATIAQLQNATASLYTATASIYNTTQSLSASIGLLSSSFLAFSNSYNTGSFSGSLVGTASWATNALNTATASSADDFLVRGTLTAQTINVQTITSSVDFVTGSTKFGTIVTNTHQFTGSVSISGSLAVNNSNVVLTNQTSSMSVATASFVTTAQTASFVQTAQTASFVKTAQTASYVLNAVSSSFASTASYWSGSINNVLSASYAATATSASNALTASYVNPLNQNVQITGSLGISGSGTLFSANVDTIIFTGSAAISGTLNVTNGITGSLLGTASFASTASFVTLAQTASFVQTAQTASFVNIAQTASFVNNAQTASFVNNAVSSSYALTASFALNVPQTASFAISASSAISSSYALTASYVLDAGTATSAFPYINPTTITGSVSIPDNHNGLLVSPISISGSITIGSGSSLLTVGPITSSTSASFASTSSYSNNILGATNYIAKFIGDNTLSSSIMYENNGRVGVNDTSPTHRFQVSGDVFTYNSSNTLNTTKYSLIGALNSTVTGSETNQYANTGIYGSLGHSATTGTFTPQDDSFVSAFLGQFNKSGGGNISGKVSSFAAGINLSGAGNVTTIAGFRAYAPLQSYALPSFSGTLTNYVGLLIDDITGTTDVGSQITNKYGIYQTGTSDKNHLAGATTINNVLQLGQLHPLPSGTDGQLAVSASNLYFFSGSAWNKISFA